MSKKDDAWSGGYVTDLEYTYGFYKHMAPAYLNFCLLIRGHRPVDLSGDFTYLELGCGNGLSSVINAATNPNGRFYAVDFNPTHIANARALVRDAGLTNITFFEKSFGELLDMDLPEFDFISLHGVWSWISDSDREAVVRLMSSKLKSGGVVYNSYNCLPGWSVAMPLRQLMIQYADETVGTTLDKVSGAVGAARKAFDADGGFFFKNGIVKQRLEQIETANKNYLAHEYFNRNWVPFYFEEVEQQLSDAKLNFVCSASIMENYPQFCMTDKQLEVYNQAKSMTMKETLKDYYINAMFRRDVYSRGAVRMDNAETFNLIKNLRFSLGGNPKAFKWEINMPKGKGDLDNPHYRGVVEQLGGGTKSFAQLLSLLPEGPGRVGQLVEILAILIHENLIYPLGEVSRECVESCQRLNKAILKNAHMSSKITFLAAPGLANGIPIGQLQQLALHFMSSKDKDPARRIWEVLKGNGVKVVTKDKTLETEEESLAELGRLVREFEDGYLPVFRMAEVMPNL